MSAFFSPSVRLDSSKVESGFGTSTRSDVVASLRSEVVVPAGARLKFRVGQDALVDRFSVGVRGQEAETNGLTSSLGVYAATDIALARWTLTPGARASAFTYDGSQASSVDPRVHVRWNGDLADFFGSVGVYSQAVIPADERSSGVVDSTVPYRGGFAELPSVMFQFFNAGFDAPRADAPIRLDRSLHASVGARVEPRDDLEVVLNPFARFTRIGSEPGASDLDPSEERALGAELKVRYSPVRWLSGTVGYTLLQATVVAGGGRRPSDFDGRHSVLALVEASLPRSWSAGLRFRLASGYPYTPISGTAYTSFGASLVERSPVFGEPASGRRPWFHQLDVRVEKAWRRERVRVAAFGDVQNVYNFIYPEIFVYPVNYTGIAGGLGLPILPSLGLQIDY